MTLQKIITFKFGLVLVFVLIHLVLLNINVAEWGDSYRILRSAESIRKGVYPSDEKRPPLLALLISVHPQWLDPVLFGRLLLMVFSTLAFIVFYHFLLRLVKEPVYVLLGLILYTFNPVSLYWSIRIMADVPFALIALLCLYLFYLWKQSLSPKKLVLLGVLVGLGVLARFEGYLLFGSLCLGILFLKGFSPRLILQNLRDLVVKGVVFVLSFSAVVVPYILFQNPFTSSYFEEPAGRAYDLKMVGVFLVSLLAVTGVVHTLCIVCCKRRRVLRFLAENPSITAFIVVELLLVFAWPAAVPRLFLPITPFVILLLAASLREFFSAESKPPPVLVIALIFNVGVYAVAQYFWKLQFLGLPKAVFLVLAVIQLAMVPVLIKRKLATFVILSTLSVVIWSLSVIRLHKDIFKSIKNAAVYIAKNIKGNVAYNDVSSVSDWYLISGNKNPYLTATYYNFEKDSRLAYAELIKRNIDYLLITNEHNTTLEVNLTKRPYLELIKEFRYNVNGKEFFSQVVKIRRFDR